MRGVSKTFTTYNEASVIPDVLWRKVRHLDIVASGKKDLFKLVTGKYGGRIMAIRKIPDWRPPILLSDIGETHDPEYRMMEFSRGEVRVGGKRWTKAEVMESLRRRQGTFLCRGYRYCWELSWTGLVVHFNFEIPTVSLAMPIDSGVLKLSWWGVFKLWRWARA